MHILIFLLLLIPSLCFGAATDSNVSFTSGTSAVLTDRAFLELGATKYMAVWVKYQRNSAANPAYQALLTKDAGAGQLSYGLYLDTATGEPYCFVSNDGTAVSTSSGGIASTIWTNSITEKQSLIGHYQKVGAGSSGLTVWSNAKLGYSTATAVGDVFDTTANLTISGNHLGLYPFNGRMFSDFGVAFADVPIIADSAVTPWNVGSTTLPFTASGVSRVLAFTKDGIFSWTSGTWTDSGQVNASYTSSTVTAGASIWGANVTGSAFLIDSTADGSQFTRNWGGKITLTDSAGKTAVGYGGARGTGVSTFGAQIWSVADCTSDPNGNESGTTGAWGVTTGTMEAQSGVTYTGGWALRHIGAAGAYQGAVAVKAATAGALYFYDGWYANTASSGRLQLNRPGYSTVLKYLAIGSVVPSWNNTIAYFNPYLAESAFQLTITMGGAASAVTQYVDNVSIKRILTPGSTGVSVYNSPANIGVEASSGWTAQSGFNWNAIVSYTISGYETDFNLDFVGNPQATRWKPTSLMELDRGPGFPSHWERFPIP